MRLLAAILALVCSIAAADDHACKVVGITDGDTVTALCTGNEQVKVRLAEIDAPEKKQPFGTLSKQALSNLCFGKQARIAEQGRDRYGRTIGRIYCFTPGVNMEIDANAEQVRTGMAWVYDRYVTDRALYVLQDTARVARLGLWDQKDPVPPWEWRKSSR